MSGENSRSTVLVTILFVTNPLLLASERQMSFGMALLYVPSPCALESRNDEQTATDRNQVLEQSNVEIRLA